VILCSKAIAAEKWKYIMLSGLYHVTLLSVQLNAESFCCWGERTVDTMLEGHMRVWAVASREGASRG